MESFLNAHCVSIVLAHYGNPCIYIILHFTFSDFEREDLMLAVEGDARLA